LPFPTDDPKVSKHQRRMFAMTLRKARPGRFVILKLAALRNIEGAHRKKN